MHKLTDDFKTNPKRCWSFLKCVIKKSSVSPVLTDSGGNLVTGDQERANLLNDVFASKFSNQSVTVPPSAPDYASLDNLCHFIVTEDAVLCALRSVSPNKACGPDNISARIISECANELVAPLVKIFRLSVGSGVFPKRWKQANIIPIYKKGDKKLPSNYRSVSLLPLFGKVLERVVYDQLFDHVRPELCQE